MTTKFACFGELPNVLVQPVPDTSYLFASLFRRPARSIEHEDNGDRHPEQANEPPKDCKELRVLAACCVVVLVYGTCLIEPVATPNVLDMRIYVNKCVPDVNTQYITLVAAQRG